MICRDEEFPEEGVKLCTSQLTHDILKIRKMARSRLSIWLEIIKKKSIKMDYTIPCKVSFKIAKSTIRNLEYKFENWRKMAD